MSRVRRRIFQGLFYQGDWHTSLSNALKLAKEGASSREILGAVEVLQKLLEQHDECVHTVSVSEPIPAGLETGFVLDCVRKEFGREATVECVEHGTLVLTTTMRGSHSYVEDWARSELLSAIRAISYRLESKRKFQNVALLK